MADIGRDEASTAVKQRSTAYPASPNGRVAIRAMGMPGDLNPNGTLFGGWILARMDEAASLTACRHSRGRTMTAGANDIRMAAPLHVGEDVAFYTEIIRVGRTSMHVRVEVWAHSLTDEALRFCSDGVFVLVAIDDDGRPRPALAEGTV